MPTMPRSIQTLMAGLIDYAGLFPPAKLSMAAAAENYGRDRMGEHEWVLGRFICPVSRLWEFSKAAAAMMPGTYATSGYREYAEAGEPWRVSAIIDGELTKDLNTIADFNQHHAEEAHGMAQIDAVELKATDAAFIDRAVETIEDDLFPFFEIPAAQDPRGLIAALSGTASGAKIRTGGVTPEAFPSCEQVARFIAACAAADVPFKATAGLHHPLRAEHPLTYEPGCPRGLMHGFLNVFLAAAFLKLGRMDETMAAAVLCERDPGAFIFTDDGVSWRTPGRADYVIDVTELAKVRETFALSYGSCSFTEPVDDLKKLGLM